MPQELGRRHDCQFRFNPDEDVLLQGGYPGTEQGHTGHSNQQGGQPIFLMANQNAVDERQDVRAVGDLADDLHVTGQHCPRGPA